MSARPYSIGLLGHGTVGGAFDELLEERAEEIERFNGRRPVISGVLDAQSAASFEEVLAGADLLVELIGGLEPAREYLLRAMRAGKDVVTANKQLLSQHGEELFETARAHDVQAALRGRGRGRRAGREGARGVALGDADRAHPRDRQRHDQLHPHARWRAARATRRRSPRRSASATPRPTRATTSAAATPPRRWRSWRASRSARRCTSTTCATRASSTSSATTSSTPASWAWG